MRHRRGVLHHADSKHSFGATFLLGDDFAVRADDGLGVDAPEVPLRPLGTVGSCCDWMNISFDRRKRQMF
jgi:hypothetical protein